jgi:3-oxoacyl-[acyl-carrier protein] reductase
MKLQGKIVLITGAGGGLGQAIATAFANEGAVVVAADFDVKSAQRTADQVQILGSSSLAIQVDVTNEAQVQQMVQQVVSKFDGMDILINNAGIFGHGKIETMSEQEWDKVINVNLKGVFLCSKAAIPFMKNKGSRIINMASVAGKTGGSTGGANYAASKAGVISLTKSLAKEMASYGVNVNAVAPGLVNGGMAVQFADQHETILKNVPLGYKAEPKDVANAVVFLASEESRYITGEIMDVNGGWYID